MFGLFGKKKIPPDLVGQWMANNLDKTCTVDSLTAEQKRLVSELKISIDAYFREFLALSAFGIDYAIITLLNGQASDVCRQAYFSAISAWPATSTKKSVELQLSLQQHGQTYFDAASKLFANGQNAYGNPLAHALEGRIMALASGSEDATWPAHNLALISVNLSFGLQYKLAEHMFVESGLIKAG